MTGQPNLVTSRRRQHELLRSWSTWAMTSILLDPSEVAHVRESGWSGTHHSDPTTGERIAGTTDGLGFGLDESWHNPRELIAWPDIEAIAESVPTEVREQLVELRDRLREHRKAYPRFAASAAAIGCGPIVEGQPLTPRQEAYVRELQEFEASGVLPAWEQKHAALDAERLQLRPKRVRVPGALPGTGGDRVEPIPACRPRQVPLIELGLGAHLGKVHLRVRIAEQGTDDPGGAAVAPVQPVDTGLHGGDVLVVVVAELGGSAVLPGLAGMTRLGDTAPDGVLGRGAAVTHRGPAIRLPSQPGL